MLPCEIRWIRSVSLFPQVALSANRTVTATIQTLYNIMLRCFYHLLQLKIIFFSLG